MARVHNGKPDGGEAAKPPAARSKRSTRKKSSTAKSRPATAAKRTRKKKDASDESGESGSARKGARMTMMESLYLAQRIAVARSKATPDTWPVIAKREGIPQRTCEHVWARFRADMEKMQDGTGLRILDETLMIYTRSIEKLAHEAEYGETSAAKVGAIRTLLEAGRARVELLSVMGRMPRSFRAMDELAKLQTLMRRAGEILERHEFPPEVLREFLDIADEITPVIEGTATRSLPSGEAATT